MSPASRPTSGALGFTVKSGWACTVLMLAGTPLPRVADVRRVELSDPAIPESRQPYHAGFGTAREDQGELDRLVASVEQFSERSLRGLLQQYQVTGHLLQGAGLVVGSLADPSKLANAHIRIHALEGQLFRRVVEQALEKAGLTWTVWRERDLHAAASTRLARSEGELRRALVDLGRGLHGPWRAEQKAAALAAWLAVAVPA